MTSPITAEERARALVQKLERDDAWDDLLPEEMAPLIASAIREAEDAALERAALHAEDQSIHPLAEIIGKAIRSLKSTKETGHE